MAPPFTPKLFRQHLDYIKNGFSSPISRPRLQDSSNSNTSTPTSATSPMSPPDSPTMDRKRKVDSTHPDEPTSKRTNTEIEDTNTTVKQMLVPVVSRKETNARLQLHQNHVEASAAARDDDSDDDFVDAEEDVADMSNGVGNPAGAETPFVNMDGVGENGLSVWQSDDADMPSSFMVMEADDEINLFPGFDNSFLDGEDFVFGEPEYGQEGIDDGGPVQLDADGIPAMAEEPIEQYEQPTIVSQAVEQQPQSPIVYDLEDGEDDPDLDAIIADANGTQAYALPLEDDSESEEAVEDLPQPQAPIHSQDSRGVHKLVAQDGQVDQFIVETGRTPEEEHQRSIYDQSELFPSIDDEPEEAQAQPDKDGTQQQQSHNTNGIFSAINYTPAQKTTTDDDDDEVQILDSNDAALIQSFKTKGYTYQAPSNRAATPPLPLNPAEGISPKSQVLPPPTTTTSVINPTYNVSKTSAPTSLLRGAELAHLNGTSGPTVPRDLAPLLKRYHDFHQRTLHLVPNLPNYKSFPWHRRYWIAILYTSKSPRSSSSSSSAGGLKEKDFMWMKGNRHSTISTIWQNYALRTMEEDFVLTCRGEVVAMEDCVEELDWFDDKLVVLRAVRRGSRVFEGLGLGEGQEVAMWKDVGVVPRVVVEVVSLDD
ncbi:hypothetical protein Slin14017_G061040 [Septoria linicola]|nr:hypothetical protein Slin14017_G061040 [Septoria linicola]